MTVTLMPRPCSCGQTMTHHGEVWLCPNCDARDELIGANVD